MTIDDLVEVTEQEHGNLIAGTIKVSYDIHNNFVDDLMVCALEGGINHWCYRADAKGDFFRFTYFTSECLTRGGEILLYEDEEEDNEGNPLAHTLTLKKFLKGLDDYCANSNKTPDGLAEDFDACDADNIVQYAIFGQVVYG